jgi:hypothetical protein
MTADERTEEYMRGSDGAIGKNNGANEDIEPIGETEEGVCQTK